jgi:hypothetical protein
MCSGRPSESDDTRAVASVPVYPRRDDRHRRLGAPVDGRGRLHNLRIVDHILAGHGPVSTPAARRQPPVRCGSSLWPGASRSFSALNGSRSLRARRGGCRCDRGPSPVHRDSDGIVVRSGCCWWPGSRSGTSRRPGRWGSSSCGSPALVRARAGGGPSVEGRHAPSCAVLGVAPLVRPELASR